MTLRPVRLLPATLTPAQRLRAALVEVSAGGRDAGAAELVGLEGLPSRERAARLLARVQRLPFRYDPAGEWVQTAGETLATGGDCEDLSALFAWLAKRAGLTTQIVWISQPSALRDHVCAAVLLDGVWWWAEPTIPGARLGESPYDAARRLGLRGGL